MKKRKFTMRELAKLGAKKMHSLYSMKGEDNPNWKGGISKNNYHYKKISKARYPERYKAREKLYSRIRNGIIKRGACEICSSKNAHAHHDDYSKPFEVRWLCRKHHRELHSNPADPL